MSVCYRCEKTGHFARSFFTSEPPLIPNPPGSVQCTCSSIDFFALSQRLSAHAYFQNLHIYPPGSAQRAGTLDQSATGVTPLTILILWSETSVDLMLALTRGEYFYLSPIQLTF